MAKIKRIDNKSGARPVKNKYLKFNGSFDLVEKFPGIDYIPYEKKKIKKSKTKR